MFSEAIFSSPESQYVKVEEFNDLMQQCTDKMFLFRKMFFIDNELDIWADQQKGTPIRALAIKYHMSRFKIRVQITKVNKKLLLLRQFFSL